MKLLDFITDYFGAQPGHAADRRQPTPCPRVRRTPPSPQPEPPATPLRPATQLAINKALTRFAFIGTSWRLALFPVSASRASWEHDLALMSEHGDLTAVTLEVLAADRSVLFRDVITFGGHARPTGIDSAGGIELPLLHRPIASHRILAQRQGKAAAYRHLLRMNWSDAEALPLQPGERIVSEHAAKVSGGRQTGEMHVTSAARSDLVVTQTGARDYAFAREAEGPLEGIFLHARFAPARHRFVIGQRLSAILISAPRGVQARSIRVA